MNFFQGVQEFWFFKVRGYQGMNLRTQILTDFDQNPNLDLFTPELHFISDNLNKLSKITSKSS